MAIPSPARRHRRQGDPSRPRCASSCGPLRGFRRWNFGLGLDLDFGFWILDFGCWNLEFGIWNLDFGCWILDFGFWILDFGFWVLGFGFWILGCCVSFLFEVWLEKAQERQTEGKVKRSVLFYFQPTEFEIRKWQMANAPILAGPSLYSYWKCRYNAKC